MIEAKPNRPIKLRVPACLYCGGAFGARGTDAERTDDHVIGRRFVPKGSLDNQWNLRGWACLKCNGMKSGLEDDISAITLQPDAWGRHPAEGQQVVDEALRKGAGAKSSRTGERVCRSQEELKVKTQLFPGVSLTVNLVCAPQLDPERVYRLAWYHLTGFFYMITLDRQTGLGSRWPGFYMPALYAHKGDWGNPLLRGFQDLLAGWEHRVHAVGASGYFKVALRRAPGGAPLWGWALEWNAACRVIGFLGDEAAAQAVVDGLPRLEKHTVEHGQDYVLTGRAEQPLPDGEDRLFVSPDEPADAAERDSPT